MPFSIDVDGRTKMSRIRSLTSAQPSGHRGAAAARTHTAPFFQVPALRREMNDNRKAVLEK
jgi:hypothetical protein